MSYEIQHCAAVIKVEGRYFYKFGKKGRVMTSWTLAGAQMFILGTAGLKEVVEVLIQRRKGFEVMRLVQE